MIRLFKYHIAKVEEDEFEDEVTLTHEDFVLGIRPECVSICEDGALEGEIFSAMPTGMETTVKVRVGEFLFTGVVFGGITYKIGQKVQAFLHGRGRPAVQPRKRQADYPRHDENLREKNDWDKRRLGLWHVPIVF